MNLPALGIGAGKMLGLQRIFARISKIFVWRTLTKKSWRLFLGGHAFVKFRLFWAMSILTIKGKSTAGAILSLGKSYWLNWSCDT